MSHFQSFPVRISMFLSFFLLPEITDNIRFAKVLFIERESSRVISFPTNRQEYCFVNIALIQLFIRLISESNTSLAGRAHFALFFLLLYSRLSCHRIYLMLPLACIFRLRVSSSALIVSINASPAVSFIFRLFLRQRGYRPGCQRRIKFRGLATAYLCAQPIILQSSGILIRFIDLLSRGLEITGDFLTSALRICYLLSLSR